MMKQTRFIQPGLTRIAIALGILSIAFASWSCSPGYSGPTGAVSIGTTTSEVNSLIFIAQDRGYFTENGLNITHKIYSSGVAAIDAMQKGEVDMATGSEYAFAGEVLAGEDIHTTGAINRSETEYLLARIDRGIKSISDIKGKTIGVPLKSRPEFSLGRFLLLRGIRAADVTLVNTPVNQSVDALADGKVDAVATWQPFVNQIIDRMGSGALTVWSTQQEQPSYNLLMCAGKWAQENPELITRFLKSLIQAETYIANNPEAAMTFIQNKLNYTEAYMTSIWGKLYFSVSLDQSLIAAMEDQSRWMIQNNVTTAKQVPGFAKYIYLDGLKSVKPGAVNIIR